MKPGTFRATAPPPVLRTVFVTDPAEPAQRDAFAPGSLPAPLPPLPPVQIPMNLLAAIGERLAAGIAAAQPGDPGEQVGPFSSGRVHAELERLERLGLQLQELVHIVARLHQLRHEDVDLGLALLQTVAECSGEADRLGVELHGPAASVPVHANPAALKHLLDLVVEHALQQGRSVRLEIERGPRADDAARRAAVRLVARVSSAPAHASPARNTLAWLLLAWFARALGLPVERQAAEFGETVAIDWPPAAG